MKMKKMIFLMLLFFLGITANVNAQVSIGGTEPEAGAILDLDGGVKGGLKLSNVDITDLGKIPVDDGELKGITGYTGDVDTNADLAGIIVYNRADQPGVPKGVYVWNGTDWQVSSGGAGGPSGGGPSLTCEPVLTVVLSATTTTVIVGTSGSVNFSVLSDGSDVFSGSPTKKTYTWYVSDASGNYPSTPTTQTYYDVPTYTAHFSGIGTYKVKVIADNCAEQEMASNEVTVHLITAAPEPGTFTITGVTCYDIAQSGPMTGRINAFQFTHDMTYTFNYTGNYSELTFVILSGEGNIITSAGNLAPGAESGTGSGSRTFHVVFANVESTLVGQSETATIGAVYKDGTGAMKTVQLNVTVKDESCCAYITGNDGRCYRLSDTNGYRQAKQGCPAPFSKIAGDVFAAQTGAANLWKFYSRSLTWWKTTNDTATDCYVLMSASLISSMQESSGSYPVACVY
jgi:hypothetical protein